MSQASWECEMPNYRNETIMLDCMLVNETDKAWLFEFDDDEKHWVPKSIGEWHPDTNEVDGEIEVPTWWAEKQGLA